MPEFFAERRQVAEFESELRESGDLEPAHVTTLLPTNYEPSMAGGAMKSHRRYSDELFDLIDKESEQ